MKVLVAGPPYRGYVESIGRAFGPETTVLEWEHLPKSFAEEILFYSSLDFRTARALVQHAVNSAKLTRAIEHVKPDLLLVMMAAKLTRETKRLIHDIGTKTVLWAYDNAVRFPFIEQVAKDYDRVYTYEPDDVSRLNGAFLPMAYDPTLYAPDHNSRVLRDVVFVGAIRDIPSRKRTLQTIADRTTNWKIGVWTDTIHWYSHRRLNDILFKGLRHNIYLTPKTIGHREISGLYRTSRMCLNMHHQQSSATNPRTFEILGSGGLLLTDQKLDYISGFESGEGYLHYSNDEELLAHLGISEDQRRRIASRGLSRMKGHTYADRAKTILEGFE